MRDFIRSITPEFLLAWNRKRKKNKVNVALEKSKNDGSGWSEKDLIQQFKNIGIQKGDVLLVHSSLSKIGYLKEGPKTIVDALQKVLGETGHLLMPNSPNAALQLDYIRNLSVFDVQKDVSKLGAITEYFRTLPGAIRSEHPTEPVSCIGPEADYFVGSHFGNLTPYNQNSPFYKVAEKKGKILYIGVTLDNAGTSLHVLEDLIEDFIFPVYFDEIFDVKIKDAEGKVKTMQTKVHNPKQSALRKCDGLLPLFEKEGALEYVTIGNAHTLLFDAQKMLDIMLAAYKKNKVTMYTPKGI
jgi:aminoglycoside 3-N-acetyltransferase